MERAPLTRTYAVRPLMKSEVKTVGVKAQEASHFDHCDKPYRRPPGHPRGLGGLGNFGGFCPEGT